jgi:dipeptidyl aminopeptidase/acylaminoacyl peptidase
MMDSWARFATVTTVLIAAMLFVGCMDASLQQTGSAQTAISIQQAPAGVAEIQLTISGPGMSRISRTLTPSTDTVILEIPIGPDRVFEASAGGYSARVVRAVTAGGVNVELSLSVAAEGTLLFARGTYDTQTGEITAADLHTIDADGGNEQQLTNLSLPVTGFGWSTDGNWILLISKVDDAAGELYRLDAGGGSYARLTTNTASETIGGIEANGTRIAYAYDGGNGSAVFTIDIGAPSPSETLVTTAAGFGYSQASIDSASGGSIAVSADVVDAWSPDGNKLIYSRDDLSAVGAGLAGRLYFTEDGGQTETAISTAAEAATGAQWLPDGSGIVFTQTEGSSTGDMDLYVYDIAGQSASALTASTVIDRNPRVSPDGTSVLFERYDTQTFSSEYRVVDVGTGAETVLTNPAEFIGFYAQWIGGTNEISVFGLDAGTSAAQIRIYSSSGTLLDTVENSQLAQAFPSQWSPNGAAASVMLDVSGQAAAGEFDLYLLSRATGQLSPITDTPEAEIGGYWRP